MTQVKLKWTIAMFVIFVTVSACQKNPQPIFYGSDACENCRMTISNPQYGSELITTKGKIYKFDSIECLADFVSKKSAEEIHSLWVTDFNQKGSLILAENAKFLISAKLRSPMGLNISAFSDPKKLEELKIKFDGETKNWEEIQDYVANEWK